MMLIAFICIIALCVVSGILYTIYGYKKEIINIAVKLAAVLCCGVLAVVCANLTSAVGGYSVFIIVGFMFLIANEAMCFIEEERRSLFFFLKYAFPTLGYLSIMVGSILFSGFNYFSIIFAVFMSCCLTCASGVAEEERKPRGYWISKALMYLTLSLFVGQGFAMLANPIKLMVAIFYLISGAFLLIGNFIKIFKVDEHRVLQILSSAFTILGMICLASSIYFI